MIKKTARLSARLIHGIHLFFRWSFISLIILFFAATLWLIYGVSLDKVEVGGYKVEKLYLKLDKKLTLRADRVVLPRRKAKPSFSRIDKTFDNIRYMLALFDDIALYHIDFNNDRFALFYADDMIYMRSKRYEIVGKIERNGAHLIADVPLLYVRAYDLRMKGKVDYDFASGGVQVEGAYEIDRITGHFRAIKRGKRVTFAVNSEKTPHIAETIKRFGLKPAIETWIVDKITAKSYKLDYLQGAFDVFGEGNIRFDIDALRAQAHASDARIRFHDAVPPADARKLIVRFKRHTLDFSAEGANYSGRSLEGTTVKISHLGDGEPATLYLNLHVVTDVEEEVHRILKAYRIDIPVRHNGKSNDIAVRLQIPLQKRERGIKAEADITLDHGMLTVGNAAFPVCKGGKIHYAAHRIALRSICVKDWWYEGTVNGEIDMRRKTAELTLQLDRMAIGVKKAPLLVIKRKKLPLHVAYGDAVRIDNDTLDVHIRSDAQGFVLRLRDLSKLTPYIRDPLFQASGGNLVFESKEMRRFRFSGVLEKNGCIFYGDKGVCYARIPIKGYYDKKTDAIYLDAFEGKFVYDGQKNRITVNRINVDMKRLFEIWSKKKRKSPGMKKRLVIKGKRSTIRYDRYRLVTDTYDIEVFPNGDIKAYGSLDGDIVKFSRKKGVFHVSAHRIRDKMLHPLIRFTGLKGGRYSLWMQGDPDGKMQGRIIVEGGVLSDFKVYNNTLAFLNTIPALATLNRPGFSKKGFVIDKGVVEYEIRDETITLHKVYLQGKTATVVGRGTIDVNSGKLDIDLAVRTVKDFAKVIGNIPVVGYLILGEDKSVTVGLKITGTLQKPIVRTTVAKDILLLPVRMLERIITSPAKLNAAPKLPPLPPKEDVRPVQNVSSAPLKRPNEKTMPPKVHDGEMF
jgi:hypothetical protein